MENPNPVCNFVTNRYIHGLIIHLIDNNPYPKLKVDIWIGSLYSGSFEVPHCFDINDDFLGSDTSVFRTEFKPIKTNKMIKIEIKTQLLYKDKVSMKLITK